DSLHALHEPDRADLEPVRRQALRRDGVLDPPVGRVAPELLADLVDLDLEPEPRLRRAVAALGPARRLVGERAAAAELVAVHLVRHRLERAGVERRRHAVAAVRAAVEQALDRVADDVAVAIDAGA